METLRMENVSLRYMTPEGETEALKKIDLTVESGEFVAIVGPSGCGKTTILSLICGLISPSGGQVALDGKPLAGKSRDVGYMLQRDQLFEWRTVEANVMLGLEVQKRKTEKTKEFALKLLERYGLKGFCKYHPNQLSGGMRQRVALIRTLATDPKLLLLDEPFSALDFQTRLSVCDDVHQIIKSEGKTALLVTHDISEAISLADRIVVLSKRPAEVRSIYSPGYTQTPLCRREDKSFPVWFDKIYKDVSV